MQIITVPQKPKYTALGENHGKFEILGCYPGYGTTLGNALRRVLLSSLDGSAVKSVKIAGVTHEFSTLSGVMEDVVQIILNLKQVRFKMYGDEPVRLTVKNKGEGVVTAGDIKVTSQVEIVNPEQVIATITDKKAVFDMEIEIDKGVGYVPVESREREENADREIGVIAIDAIYTPVKRVNYEIENMRVGKRTDYDKVTLEIVTDGSINPIQAFEKSVAILIAQFSSLVTMDELTDSQRIDNEVTIPKKAKKVLKKKAEKDEETA
ncbi:MAG: DNA-directed RNA polymerase subunit alpha [Minisyncoccota bacterium]